MKTMLFAAASAFALGTAPATAQHMNMPGMTMPMAEKKPTPKKKPAAKKKASVKKMTAKRHTMPMEHHEAPSAVQQMSMDHSQMGNGTMQMPAQSASGGETPMEHSQTGHGEMGQMPMGGMKQGEHGGHEMAMTGALGPYPMERESSGTAWQPDTSDHAGLRVMSGD
ncbi:MAG: hypothetical protein HOQ20_20210, partial [Bradyrhizobium sp.]|nr:hypothetical protein [Bradyrhizobium sp.]